MVRELRDIEANHGGAPDLAYLQRKIAAAGEMKTGIKRFLDDFDDLAWLVYEERGRSESDRYKARVKGLRKAMEDYLNA